MNQKTKIYIASIFILTILILGAYTYIHKDELFKSVTVITFPDGCNETYINGILNNSECTYGRWLHEQQTQVSKPEGINIEGVEWE